MAFSLRRTRPNADIAPAPELKTADTDAVIVRFLTVGGATVELRSHRFTTRWRPLKGRPDVIAQPYEVDGYAWKCLGCDAYGRDPHSYEGDYLQDERGKAREDANTHANGCRAMPRQGAAG